MDPREKSFLAGVPPEEIQKPARRKWKRYYDSGDGMAGFDEELYENIAESYEET